MLRDRVAPGLRELGFVGSGSTFRLLSGPGTRFVDVAEEDPYALLGVRAWRYNDADLARFTLDVAFYTADEWAYAQALLAHGGTTPPDRPSPGQEYFTGWHDRIGYLSEPGHDHWWGLRTDADATAVAADVLRKVAENALPQLTARLEGRTPPPDHGDGGPSDLWCLHEHCWADDDI